jgi:2,4-dienoyl-CoA reductase-like NADH-dependent reductase (Old Yellow Enzyme family)/NADPH-dependent 2,4-dienoyl-CoA reductase/sulfur reductase-like enzyme
MVRTDTTRNPYLRLLAPGRIGAMQLRNRMVVTSMGVGFAEADGSVGDRLVAYHAEQAKGGAGLIIAGVTGVAWPVGAVHDGQIAISGDRFLPGLRRVAEAVHAEGAKIAAQLHHCGLVAGYSAGGGHPLWAPSMPRPFSGSLMEYFLPEELAAFAGGPVPAIKVLEADEIAHVVRQFAAGAQYAQAAGFDGCEIHGGHGYLISSFLSPHSNQRTDEYGGSLENRARFMLEVLRSVRAAVGSDFAVWMKLDAAEYGRKPGTTLEEAKQVAKWLEQAGADAITVTSYHDPGNAKLHSSSNIPHVPETNIPASSAIKAGVGIPIIASGRVEPARASTLIGEGAFDFLGMGRKLLADPHLPRKLAAGAPEEVRPCIYCYTCVSNIYVRLPMRCAVNATTGLEHLADRAQAPTDKHYVVIGGGPAGMEAARQLAGLGNRVTLLERSDRLGGTLRFASLAYEPNERLLEWLRRQVAKSAADVRLNTDATPELVRSLVPDHVFVARGAVREMPPIPGVELDHVFSGDDLRRLLLGETSEALKRTTSLGTRLAAKVGAATGMTGDLDFVRKATRKWMPLGDRIAIVGGELVGVELAEFLAERGRKVTVIEEGPRFGKGLTLVRRLRLIPELEEHGVTLHAEARDIAITRDGVTFSAADGSMRRVAADNVIIAKGARSDSTLADALRAAGLTVTEIGDGTGVGYLEGAVRGAARAVLGAEAIPPV